jgi:nucleoside-diphosphate-sugar epimerase
MINPINKLPTISILGCGWFGMALAKKLFADGYQVKGSTTSKGKLAVSADVGIEAHLVLFEPDISIFEETFFQSEILIVCIPPKRNSPTTTAYREKIGAIAEAAKKNGVKQIIFISSTGVYEDGNFIVNEALIPKPQSDSGKLIFAAEQLLLAESAFHTTIIRFAGLIGPERTLTKHLTGKDNITNGLAPINLIHLTDCIGLTQTIIEKQAFGKIYHGVSPHHPTRQDFYTKNCLVRGLPIPHFIPELLTWKKIESINVPELGYQYEVSNWDKWLAQVSS